MISLIYRVESRKQLSSRPPLRLSLASTCLVEPTMLLPIFKGALILYNHFGSWQVPIGQSVQKDWNAIERFSPILNV